MTIAKKIALITGGNIHKEERETPLPSLGRRQRARIAESPIDTVYSSNVGISEAICPFR